MVHNNDGRYMLANKTESVQKEAKRSLNTKTKMIMYLDSDGPVMDRCKFIVDNKFLLFWEVILSNH